MPSMMTKAEAIMRVEAYLHHACAVLLAHEAFKKCPLYEKASRSVPFRVGGAPLRRIGRSQFTNYRRRTKAKQAGLQVDIFRHLDSALTPSMFRKRHGPRIAY